jgi:4-methylaminobutanoate oxidase (formaldehyde-forming)
MGKDAAESLSLICANDVDRATGRLTYTQMLNSRGGIECDLTVARLADDHYYIVSGTGFRTHDFAWIAKRKRGGLRPNWVSHLTAIV